MFRAVRCSAASASSIIHVTGVPKHSSLGEMDTCYHRQRCTQAALQPNQASPLRILEFDHQQCNSPLDVEAAIRVSRSAMKSCTSCKNLSFSTASQHQRVFPHFHTHHHARHRNKIPETAGHFYEQPGSQKCSCKVVSKIGRIFGSSTWYKVAPKATQQHDPWWCWYLQGWELKPSRKHCRSG